MGQPRIILCRCAEARVLPAAAVEAALRAGREAGGEVTEVADLCALAARRDPRLAEWAADAKSGAGLRVVACYPRAVRWLFAAAGAELPESGVEIRSLRGEGEGVEAGAAGEKGAEKMVRGEGGVVGVGGKMVRTADPTWFPVIDYGRCTQCMQCLSFCLFDVYGVSAAAKIAVKNPANCKPDCPACARVCPEAAIMFPKYKAGPISGEEIAPGSPGAPGGGRPAKVDISALLGGDVYAALRQRTERAKVRFASDRDEGQALQERLRCLAQLQEQMDIPPEVLAALPSVEEIRARAEKAQAAARAAVSRLRIPHEGHEDTKDTKKKED